MKKTLANTDNPVLPLRRLLDSDLTGFGTVPSCTTRWGFDGIPTVRFGTVLRNRESYGAVGAVPDIGNPTVWFVWCYVMYPTVPCGFQQSYTLRCGSVRFSDVVNPTMRCSVIFYVLRCGSVRFADIVRPTMRCGAVFQRAKILRWGNNCTEPHRTDRKNRTAKNPPR